MRNKIFCRYFSIFALLIFTTIISVHAESNKKIESMTNQYIQDKIFGMETLYNLREYYSQKQIDTFAQQYKTIGQRIPQDKTKVKFFFCGDIMAFLTVIGGQGYACLGPGGDFYSLGGIQTGVGLELSAGLSLMVYWGDENFIGDYEGGRIGYSYRVGGQALWADQVSDNEGTKDPKGFIVLAGARIGYGGTLSGSMAMVQGDNPPLFRLDEF